MIVPDVGIHARGGVDLQRLLRKMKREVKGKAGGITCFVGTVRGSTRGGKKVRYLHYEAARNEAIGQLREIASDAERKKGILRVMIHHIVDDLKPGEDTIYLLIASEHRAEAFSILPKLMNRIKKEVFIWKKEVYERGARWVEDD